MDRFKVEFTRLSMTPTEFADTFYKQTKIRFEFSEDMNGAMFNYTEEQLTDVNRLLTMALNEGRTLTHIRAGLLEVLGIEVPKSNGDKRYRVLRIAQFFMPDDTPAQMSALIKNVVRSEDNRADYRLEAVAYYMGRQLELQHKSKLAHAALKIHRDTVGITDAFILQALNWDSTEINAFINKHLPNGLWRKSK